MTDADLVERKLGHIEACVADLRCLAEPAKIKMDLVHQRFVLHTLQIAVQGIIDVASHIVSSERLGEPDSNQQLITRLTQHGWLEQDQAMTLHEMLAFRNVVVHGYAAVDLGRVEQIVTQRLGDFDDFVRAVRSRLRAS